MNSWQGRALLPGTRVRVVRDTSWDGPWQREFTGVLSPSIAPHFWGNEGDTEYFVVFDEPQIDCDGCGPYVKAMIRSRYIRVDLRGGWVVPAVAPRPSSSGRRVVDLDMVAQPELQVATEPGVLFRVSLPGIEADCYTDSAGRTVYVETVPGTVPNRVLEVAQAGAIYVVHPVLDGRFAVVLRTDEQARLVEVVADPVAPVGSYGPWVHPLEGILGGWPGQVSPHGLLAFSSGPAADGLAVLARRLIEAVNHGQRVAVRVQVFHADTGVVPSQFQVDYAIDGQNASGQFPNT